MARAGEGGAQRAAAAAKAAAFATAGNNSTGARAARNCCGGARSWTVKTLRPYPRPHCVPAPRCHRLRAPCPAAPRAALLEAPPADRRRDGLGTLRGRRAPPSPETGRGAWLPEVLSPADRCRGPRTLPLWVGENPGQVEPMAPPCPAWPPRLRRSPTRTVEPLHGFGRCGCLGRGRDALPGCSRFHVHFPAPIFDRKPRYAELAKCI